MQPERRTKRSNFHAQALDYLLDAVAHAHDVDMVLADEAGLLVASSTDTSTAEALAAVAPLAFDGELEAAMAVDCLDLEGQAVYLCAIGDDLACQSSMDSARHGITRILQSA